MRNSIHKLKHYAVVKNYVVEEYLMILWDNNDMVSEKAGLKDRMQYNSYLLESM